MSLASNKLLQPLGHLQKSSLTVGADSSPRYWNGSQRRLHRSHWSTGIQPLRMTPTSFNSLSTIDLFMAAPGLIADSLAIVSFRFCCGSWVGVILSTALILCNLESAD